MVQDEQTQKPQNDTLYTGGCHCGAVKFEVMAPSKPDLIQCNCSICSKTGFLHLIVEADDFRLLSGEEDLVNYQFNTKTAKHYFCKHCGIKSFYVPRSHPNGFSVHAGCLDDFDISEATIKPLDGKNWEKNVAEIL